MKNHFLIVLILIAFSSISFNYNKLFVKELEASQVEDIINIRILLNKGDISNFRKIVKGILFQESYFIYQGKEYEYLAKKYFVVTNDFPLSIKGIKYSGKMIIEKDKENLFLINEVDLENYLVGVVRGEISYSWHNEAIKAQAIAARSYAYYLYLRNIKAKYHLDATSNFQVFKGIINVHENIRRNVLATKGKILVHSNEPIMAFFHASCGGMTEKAENVWNSNESLKYYKNIRCYYCRTHPKYKWELSFLKEEIHNRIERFLQIKGVDYIRIKSYTSSRRVKQIEIITQSKRKYLMNGNQFRGVIGSTKLYSTKFVIRNTKGRYYFKGNGYGHGVGLCQWGAKTMAEKGYSYKKILFFYYKNVTLKSIEQLKRKSK